jgi:hypothetical protein
MRTYILSTLLFCLFFISTAEASGELFLGAPESFIVGEKVPVTLFLDTGGVSINSIDVTLTLSDPTLTLAGYQDYNSIVKFWISPPKQSGNTVSLVGGIPGGIASITQGVSTTDRIPLVVLLFEAKAPTKSTLSVVSSSILQNDGEGTAFVHTTKGVSLIGVKGYIGAKEGKDTPVETKGDAIPPAFEQISLIPSSLLSKNPTLVMFSATDEESGIANYDVLVDGRKIENAQSPLVVNKKVFSYTVFVEAYDLYGNKQTASVIVPGVIVGDRWVWLLFIVAVLGGFVYNIKRRYAKK